MPAADEIQEVVPGCYLWRSFCSKAKVELFSHALICADQLYLIDPIRLTKAGLSQTGRARREGVRHFLTNGNHERDATFYQDRYAVPVYADPNAAAELALKSIPCPEKIGDLEILPLPGAGMGEIAIHDLEKKLLCVGDIIINLDSLAFAPLPDKYAVDPKEMRNSIRSLTTLDVSILCFAHGLPIKTKVRERLASLAV